MSLRILQVIPNLDTGGAERTTLDVAEAVIAAGGTAHVFCEPGGRLEPELVGLGGQVWPGKASSKNPLVVFGTNPGRIADLARRQRIDLIHARSRAPAWSALLAARRCGLPFVTTYHGVYNASSPLKRWYNSVMARGDLVIANSHYTARHLMETHGTPEARVRVIPRGVDLRRFDRAAVAGERVSTLRASWGLASRNGAPVVLLPARLTGWKGQRPFIRALGLLAAQGRAVTGVLAGDDQGRSGYTDELRALAAACGVAGHVVFAGHCADVPAAILASDLVVCPSTEPEAFGRTAAEAQAMGVPVIASDLGGAREVVDPGRTGLLVAPNEPAELAAAIGRMLDMTGEEKDAMGAAGVARVRYRFSTTALQTATLAVYAELTRGRANAA
jgi:glycosyltransferase involved in cell wall biosynthesis